MSDTRRKPAFAPSGFFAFRTALLPFEELLDWAEGLEAAAAVGDPTRLEQALSADRGRLRTRLSAAVTRPEIRDALFVASPDLDESLDVWLREPESDYGQRIERALVRYFARMAGRATPFGLFGGHSVGEIGNETRLVIAGRAEYQRHTRLDMDYLFALVDALGRDPALKDVFDYRPNSSLYRAAGRVRYVESRLDGDKRAYHLVAAEPTDYLDAILALAEPGARAATLAAALVDEDISLSEAKEYIAELIGSQVLVPELALNATGLEPIHSLLKQLREHEPTRVVVERLERVRDELAAIDGGGLGAKPERYRATARLLDDLPAKAKLPRLFQVDMVKPSPGATLGPAVLAEIVRGVEILHGMARRPREDALARFADAFRSRYEEREVPLVEALDEEMGIGFPPSRALEADATPLLRGLNFPPEPDETTAWGKREIVMQRKLAEALAERRFAIVLEPRDLEEMAASDPLPLPGAFSVSATVAAASDQELASGRFRVLLGGAFGPSGAPLLGRFCHADPTLRRCVERHLRCEEALDPEAVFAEIVHLPEGRTGNILLRPVLRDYEIAYLGRSGAPVERQIPVSDLLVSVSGQRVVLRSARLGRRVIPRLSSAHNFSWASLGTYHFLCALQGQGLAWDWGALKSAPFLPRVTTGRLVLLRAQWRLSKEEVKRLGKHRGAERFQVVQAWRAERRLPRLIALADADNTLPVDLDNVLCVESFVHLVKSRDEAILVEVFPGSDELCARGPEGRFVHEIVVPFVRVPENREPEPARARAEPPRSASTVTSSGFQRSFPPGSEWLYLKLYGGTATADHLLGDVIAPFIREGRVADLWFFVRYADPDSHLRLRFHGAPHELHQHVLPALQATIAPLLDDGRIWRIQLDTYEREVERYGGPEGIVLAERIFHADADAVLEIVEMLDQGDQGADERWRLTVRGIDMLLADLGFDLETKRVVLERVRDEFAKEFRADRDLKRKLSEKFEKERKALEALLDRASDAESALSLGLDALERRSERLAPLIAELKACEQAGRLSRTLVELAPSYIHMHANRLLRAAHRRQEVVLYDFLARLYESRAARARAG